MKWYPVRVHFPGTPWMAEEWMDDEIRGTNPENALENARWNWPGADAILIKYEGYYPALPGKEEENGQA